jgi:hypothetical protein
MKFDIFISIKTQTDGSEKQAKALENYLLAAINLTVEPTDQDTISSKILQRTCECGGEIKYQATDAGGCTCYEAYCLKCGHVYKEDIVSD